MTVFFGIFFIPKECTRRETIMIEALGELWFIELPTLVLGFLKNYFRRSGLCLREGNLANLFIITEYGFMMLIKYKYRYSDKPMGKSPLFYDIPPKEPDVTTVY